MNYLKKFLLILLIPILFTTHYVYASSIVLNQEQLVGIKKQNMGKKWLMLLWSVDCPPCFKELGMIQKLKQKQANLNVVLINTDASEETRLRRREIINKFQLMDLPNFHFAADQGAQSRFIIDPNWYGELPRSYFFESNGQSYGKSGVVDESLLVNWLGK
jgi:thiol-disulfide isomerase/thioredoxin